MFSSLVLSQWVPDEVRRPQAGIDEPLWILAVEKCRSGSCGDRRAGVEVLQDEGSHTGRPTGELDVFHAAFA